MAKATNDAFPAAEPGTTTLRIGRPPLPVDWRFANVDFIPGTGQIVSASEISNSIFVLDLHGRGDHKYTTGYVATCSGELAHDTYNTFKFQVEKGYPVQGADGTTPYYLKPSDNYITPTNSRIDSRWIGFTNMTGPEVNCITERRLLALLTWARENVNYDHKRFYCGGYSMGAYGTMQFGMRRPDIFAAIYPDSPQWRYGYDTAPGKFPCADFVGGWLDIAPANSPVIRGKDGGGRLYDRIDHLTYISDPTKKIPWIGWATGFTDNASPFEDHIEAVNILKATGRGFAFYWDTGGHTSGRVKDHILESYKYGTFELGKGYPCFRNHSLDQVPGVDPVGGINIGLTFRGVEESTASWTCEITNVDGPCEVDVTPISDVFKQTVPAQRVQISGANQWVRVTFPA